MIKRFTFKKMIVAALWRERKYEEPILPDLGRAEQSLDLVTAVNVEMDKHISDNFCRRNSLQQDFVTGGGGAGDMG